MKFKRIAVDTSKYLFTLHAVDVAGQVVRMELPRRKFLTFFGKLEPTLVTLEACGGSHHWGRALAGCGHQVRLIPPQYVKPFVKRGKNDRIDAAAIHAASEQPDMTFVPVRSAENQAAGTVLRTRELLVRQRTQLVNAIRGHAAEWGLVTAKGIAKLAPLLVMIEASDIPERARRMIAGLGEDVAYLDRRIADLDAELRKLHAANPVSRRLAEVPGVGPITAITVAITVDPGRFRSGRHLAAWLGLTPREHSTGGKQRLGRISRAGHERLRQLLVVGATAAIRAARSRPGSPAASPWLLGLLARKPAKLAAVALANKTARILWAMMSSGEAYRCASPRPAG